MEASRVGGRCRVRKRGRPGALILEVLIRWSHTFIDLSDWPHMSYAKQNLKVQDKDQICSDIEMFIFERTNHDTKTISFGILFLTM